MELEQVFKHFAERMRRKNGLGPAPAAENDTQAMASSGPETAPVPVDGRPWSDDERERVEQALAALKATRQPSHRPPLEPSQPEIPKRGALEPLDGPEVPVSVALAPEPSPPQEYAIPRPPVVEPLRWYGPDEVVEVAGYRLPGLVLVARSEADASRTSRAVVVMDMLVDADSGLPDFYPEFVAQEPLSYPMLTSAGRAHFLHWLSTGCPGDVPLDFAHLRFRMLEDRIKEATIEGLEGGERRALKAAMDVLIDNFGQRSWQLREYGRRLADILGVFEFPTALYLQAPPEIAAAFERPVPLQVALGQAARDKATLPAAWALAALLADINTPKRVPLTRCASEFADLFAVRFKEAFPEGLRLRASRNSLRLSPFGHESHSGDHNRLSAMVPSACLTDFTPTQRSSLAGLIRRCADELAEYSRHLGKAPEARGTPEAQMKLPDPLLTNALQEGVQALKMSANGAAVTIDHAARVLWGPGCTVPAKAVPALRAFLAKVGIQLVAAPVRQPPDKADRSAPSKDARVKLDEARLERIKNDDAKTTTLLAALFADEREAQSSTTASQPVERVAHPLAHVLPSLDEVHLDLLGALLGRDCWTSAEVEALASARGLMALGALEHLNDAALDVFDEPLLTSDDEVELHPAVALPLRQAASGANPS